MSASLRRMMAIVLAFFSAASLVVTIFLFVKTWQSSNLLQEKLVAGIDKTQESLSTASGGLVVTQKVLTDTQNILQGTVEMMLSIAASIHEVPPVLRDLEDLSGESLPKTITATQLSLAAAQDSAGRIEDMLGLVSQIPFFPGGKYEPKVTLKDALGQVAEDLEGVRKPLENMQVGIKSTRSNLEGVEVEGVGIALELRKVSIDLQKAGKSLNDSQEQIEAFNSQLQNLEEKIPRWVVYATWFVTFFLTWIGLAQIGWLIYAIRSI